MKVFWLVLMMVLSWSVYAQDRVYVGAGGEWRTDKSVWWGEDTAFGWRAYGEWKGLRLEVGNAYFGDMGMGLRWNLDFIVMLPNYFLRPLLKDLHNEDWEAIGAGLYLAPAVRFEYDSYLENITAYEVVLGYRLVFSKQEEHPAS